MRFVREVSRLIRKRELRINAEIMLGGVGE
jgi:hypothetical protein